MIKHLLRGTAALALTLAATTAPAAAAVSGSPAPLQPAYIVQNGTGYKWYCSQTLSRPYLGAWVVQGRTCRTSG